VQKQLLIIPQAILITISCLKPQPVSEATVVRDYSLLVHASYLQARKDAQAMQKSVSDFLAAPSDAGLKSARDSWIKARVSYSQTEAFRFYGGPIDRPKSQGKEEGPEALLNSWPVNESYIDYVKGNPGAGIINDPRIQINATTLTGKNQQKDEADVATGFHAIEFLLWGQDFNPAGPGDRPVSDYTTKSNHERRKQYLRVTTDMVVTQLRSLEEDWAPGKENNYAAEFQKLNSKVALGHILTGLVTLAGFELASERTATALKSGDQEDEQSCFSDNTHNDFINNIQGILNVYEGRVGDYSGIGLDAWIKSASPEMADQILEALRSTKDKAISLPVPVDSILASPKNSDSRQKLESLSHALAQDAKLFQKAGILLGVDARLIAE
jgi:putative iron-regulated protein